MQIALYNCGNGAKQYDRFLLSKVDFFQIFPVRKKKHLTINPVYTLANFSERSFIRRLFF